MYTRMRLTLATRNSMRTWFNLTTTTTKAKQNKNKTSHRRCYSRAMTAPTESYNLFRYCAKKKKNFRCIMPHTQDNSC